MAQFALSYNYKLGVMKYSESNTCTNCLLDKRLADEGGRVVAD